MTAAYRMRGLGWFLAVVVVALGFYLVSLQVAAERKKLDDIDRAIARTHRTIRGLETEYNTRANLAQIERWNGDVLALAAPLPDQFLPDEAQLAMVDFRPGAERAEARRAMYLVPALPVDADRGVATQAPGTPEATPAPVTPPAPGAPVGLAQAASAARGRQVAIAAVAPAAVVPVHRDRSVAMLDRKVVNDNTLSELLSRADINLETGR